MTTIFTRNLALFIIVILLVKCTITNTFGIEREKPIPVVVQNSSVKNIHKPVNSTIEHDKSCLGVTTNFPVIDKDIDLKDISDQDVQVCISNNTVGTVNIICSDGYIYKKQNELWHIANTIPFSDIITKNKIIIKVNPKDSEILDKRIKETSNVGYIVNGTMLEEIYFNQGIDRIEKMKLKTKDGYFYLLELDSAMGSRTYGEEFLTHLDNARRFINR